MRRRFIALAIAATSLVALIGPASSQAYFSPPGGVFEIKAGNGWPGPTLKSAYGYCQLKIEVEIPQTVGQEGYVPLAEHYPEHKRPSLYACPVGSEIGGEWLISGKAGTVNLQAKYSGGTMPLTLRWNSLPGCKLITPSMELTAKWTNGGPPTYTPTGMSGISVWQNNSALETCSLAGKTEQLVYYMPSPAPGNVWLLGPNSGYVSVH
jgi:hypothetical protein